MPLSPANCARLQSPALLTSRLQNVLVIVNYQGLIQSRCPIIKASLSDSSANGRAGYTASTEPPLTVEHSIWSANACHCDIVSFNFVWLQNLKLHLNVLEYLSECQEITTFICNLCRDVCDWGCNTKGWCIPQQSSGEMRGYTLDRLPARHKQPIHTLS